MRHDTKIAFRVAFSGMMLALAIALAFVEGSLPALPMLPAGIKLGLSNIVVMYAVLFIGARQALLIMLLKSVFVFLTRGATGAFLSLAGGAASVAVMLLLRKFNGLSPLFLSIGGSVSHNIGQLIAAAFILQNAYTFYYVPVLILSGILMGVLTGTLLKFVLPCLRKIDRTLQ